MSVHNFWRRGLTGLVLAFALTGWSTIAQAKKDVCDDLTDRLAIMEKEEPEDYAKLMEEAAKIPNAQGLLWKIEKEGLEPSWLFGTMHVTDKRITTLAAPVEEAFTRAQHTAFEIDTVNTSRKAGRDYVDMVLDHVILRGSLRRYLKRADLEDVAYAAQAHNVHPNQIFRVKPLFVILQIGSPTCATRTKGKEYSDLVLDDMLAERADKEGKSVTGLETMQEHFGFLDKDMKLKDQLRLLVLMSRESINVGDESETYIAAYLRRNFAPFTVSERMEEFYPEYWSEKDKALYDRFWNDLLLTKRNYLMAERAVPLIEKGLAFVAVGAAHLSGEEGLVELLRAEGYTLTSVW